nr:reverse transcriptase domain-containing protein [Tanacetum cinerariifolium]
EICVTCGGAHPYYQCLAADGNTFLELMDNIQGYVAAATVNYNQEETLTDQDLTEYTIKVPPLLVQKPKPPSQRNFVVHQKDPFHPNIPYSLRMHKQKQQEKDGKILKALLSNKEKLLELANTPLNENCSAVILKKLPEKLGDPGKFLISYGFSELKCKSLADLGASINLMSLFVWKKLGLLELISTRMTLELANRAICTPAGIARDVFVLVGKFTFPTDFVIVDYESSTTSTSPNHLLEEFVDELALITFPPGNDDLCFDIESDLKEIEYLLYQDPINDMVSILEDLIDQSNLVDLNDNLVDTMPEMFTDEHVLDY